MTVFKNYDGEIINLPIHTHKVKDTVGQRLIGSAAYPDNINDFVYINYTSGQMSGGYNEELLGSRNIKVFYLNELFSTSYGELSIELGSSIDINSKYILYLESINDENVLSFVNINNIKFSTIYPYNYTDDVQFTIRKINNIGEFGANPNLYEISFSGSNSPRCIYLPLNISPAGTLMTTNFLKASFRKIEYTTMGESVAYVTTTDDGFMNTIDKVELDNLYKQSFSMLDNLKKVLFVNESTKIINLIDGANFNKALKSIGSNATSVVFTKTAIPTNKINSAVMISNENNENKAYMYLDNTTVYVAPERTNDILIAPLICSGMFMGLSKLVSIDFTNFIATGLAAMSNMFSGCTKLTTLTNISGFNTSRVTDMYGVFDGCSSLTSLNLSSWNVSSVTTTQNMFNGCTNLSSIQISRWDFNKLINTTSMFNGCTKLSFNMIILYPLVTQYANMFTNCSTVSPAKFILGYSGTSLKQLATNMVATKSVTSNVLLPAIFVATVTNARWDAWAGGASYSITSGMSIGITGDVGTLTYTWNVYKVYIDYNNGVIKTTKVLATKTNNTVTIAEYKSIGLEYVNSDTWSQVGYDGHDTLAGYVTIKNVTSAGTETQTIYVGDTFAKKYLPA